MNLKNIPGRTEAKKRLTHFWTKFLALYKMQEVTRFRRTNFLTENRKSFEEKKCSGTKKQTTLLEPKMLKNKD